MKSPHQIGFSVASVIGKNRIIANAVIDKKNNSIHIHLYGEMFGNKRVPIQVKNSDIELKEGKEEEVITQVKTDHFLDQPFSSREDRKTY